MNDKEKLKPCPFCGGKACVIVYPIKGKHKCSISCIQCGAVLAIQDSTDMIAWSEAFKKWNRREYGRNEEVLEE